MRASTSNEEVPTAGKRQILTNAPAFAALIGLVFLIVFLTLRSNAYLSVDGALRCLNVLFSGERYQGNNHMLYPFWIGLWDKMNGLVGLHASDAFRFIRMSQSMNAFFAAACVALLYYLIDSVAGAKGALLGTLTFAFSTALTSHATNSAEVLPGLFFALLALVILAAGIHRSSRLLLIIAGGVLALALASYEAMGTVAGAAALMCYFWPGSPGRDKKTSFVWRLVCVALGGLVGVCLVYGASYADQGIPLNKMPRALVSMGGQPEVYGGANISKVLNFPMGLIQSLLSAAPPGYNGLRSLAYHSHRLFWLGEVVAALALVGAIAFFTVKAWQNMAHVLHAGQLAIILGGLAIVLFPLVYWAPMYDKLWLLPLACCGFAVGVALRSGLLAPGSARLFTALLLVCVSAEIAVNLRRLVLDHERPTPHLEEARALSKQVQPADWVVLDFDDVSQLWLAIWGQKAHTLLLPASSSEEAIRWLTEAKTVCRKDEGRILFVSVLQHDRASWDMFLGSRLGIPFELLDEYRRRAVPLPPLTADGSDNLVSQFRPN